MRIEKTLPGLQFSCPAERADATNAAGSFLSDQPPSTDCLVPLMR